MADPGSPRPKDAPLTLYGLALYTLWIGPLTPGELKPYPLPHLALWLTPVDTPKGPLYTASRGLRRWMGHRPDPASSVLARELDRRMAYEYLVALGALPRWRDGRIYLTTPAGVSIPISRLRLGRRHLPHRGQPALRLVEAWWQGLKAKPLTLPLKGDELPPNPKGPGQP